MRKPKTRRSISLKGTTYHRLKGYCDSRGVSVSGCLEALIAGRLDAQGVPEFRIEDLPQRRPRVRPSTEAIAAHFTF